MASTDYSYDDQGQYFPFFLATVAALVTLPLSYSLLTPSKDIENAAPRIQSNFKPTEDDLIQGQKRKQWRRERRLKRIITVAIGWFTIAAMCYLIVVTERTKPKIWDPYDILEISRSASEQQIKKRYRDLSRVHHPDKAVIDETKNQTAEGVNEYWVEVSKAFKALTDEDIRNNYIQFGHPDGKQSFSIGIALPKFIVTEGNGKYVLLVYGLLLGVLLPYLVGKWWYGTQRLTKEKVLIKSANNLFREYQEIMDDGDVVNALSSAEEYDEVLMGSKADSGMGKLEKRIISEAGASSAIISSKDQKTLQEYEGVRRKVAALLWAYLGRVRIDGSTLDEEKYEVGPIALKLNESFIATTLAFGNISPLLSAFSVSQHLIQAIPPNASPLLQLPHITPAVAKAIEGPSSRTHLTIQQFMGIPEYKRRKLATDQPSASLTPAEYNNAMAVARQLPLLKVEKAFFKVTGEKFVTPSSLVQLVVKARVIPPGSLNVPPVAEKDLEDPDPEEGDLDALHGRTLSSRSKKAKMIEGDAPLSSDAEKPLLPPLAYAPYFPRDHSPRWNIFLADAKMGKVAVPPFAFTTFDKPLVNENGQPSYFCHTLKSQFQAPPQVGRYEFVMHLVCDSYIGMDSSQSIVLEVEDATKAVDMANEDDEISEPDEESLAGQLNSLKGAPPPKKKKAQAEADSDSGSDTEGDDGDDDSDETNTDTENEDD